MSNGPIPCRECLNWRQKTRAIGMCEKGIAVSRYDHNATKPTHCQDYEPKYVSVGNGTVMPAKKGGE